MTIVTKPLTSEKKPQVGGIGVEIHQPLVKNDLEKGLPKGKLGPNGGLNERYHYILRTRASRVSSATTLCLLITALLVMTIGLFGGIYVYRQMTSSRARFQKLWCNVPYSNSRLYTSGTSNDELNEPLFSIPQLQDNEPRKIDNDGLSYYFGDDSLQADADMASFFRENFELDVEDEVMAKIEVPDFKNGRMGRFIHEFDSNKTAIVDQSSGRCFVMPLDREKVLPPKTMFDMLQKMSSGYYSVNTRRVRESMRVVQPPLTDFSDLGEYIKQECMDKTTYRLEKSTQRIVKRSVAKGGDKESKPFAETVGYYTIEYDIVNLDQLP